MRPLLTNLSSDSQGSHPRPTSLEAILHPAPHAVVDDAPVDPRLGTARRWTNVTSDPQILASILSAWTTREYYYYHYLDREAFLDDMAAGRLEFCSELLVNALLASACVGPSPFSPHDGCSHQTRQDINLSRAVYQFSGQREVETLLRSIHHDGFLQRGFTFMGS
jgi:hypothetical protein